MNYNKAVADFNLFKNYKQKKYMPILDCSKLSFLSGEDSQGKAYELRLDPFCPEERISHLVRTLQITFTVRVEWMSSNLPWITAHSSPVCGS
jgi:hypothetical protein